MTLHSVLMRISIQLLINLLEYPGEAIIVPEIWIWNFKTKLLLVVESCADLRIFFHFCHYQLHFKELSPMYVYNIWAYMYIVYMFLYVCLGVHKYIYTYIYSDRCGSPNHCYGSNFTCVWAVDFSNYYDKICPYWLKNAWMPKSASVIHLCMFWPHQYI